MCITYMWFDPSSPLSKCCVLGIHFFTCIDLHKSDKNIITNGKSTKALSQSSLLQTNKDQSIN